ncbi:hypothetical protein A4212_09995 [Pasteurella multocida]|uniref:hypothetical protein n=1 Tax=Pasteurella multocida TaxID=747 RepID=UPI00094ADE6E|nr:hypothetical protein [Pasteurella multocida]AUK45187.1 hypothetical protein A4212_08285 [Pasteurella multocida]AUK45506.1 hypothetical protein A4212_09995 [Pasteurella multocida]HEH9695006.1 hypothetical protein [Pasteurella multocida]HEH9720099.1 hypothetical protein [Pasteurella multocida]HEH9818880.1 hypothetical protein [Pasteurella multocida]
MKREIRGITFFSLVWEVMIFGGFIYANEFAIKNLIQAYEWFFYFMTVLASLAFFLGISEAKYQYTKAKFNFEIVTNTLLGIMLAYYGYFVFASILTFFGYGLTAHNYFIKESKNEKAK